MTTARYPLSLARAAALCAAVTIGAPSLAPSLAFAQTAPQVVEQARQALQKGNVERAVALLQQALKQAAKAGSRTDAAAAAAEISRLRESVPAWAADKLNAASTLPEAKQKVAGMWDRFHKGAIAAANAGNMEQALERAAQALSIARDNFGDGHFVTIVSANDMATLQGLAGQTDAAEATWQQALKAATAALGGGHPETLKIQGTMADHYAAQTKFAQAGEIRAAMAKTAAAALGASHPQTLAIAAAQGRDLRNAGRYAEAEKVLAPACTATRKVFGDFHPETARCLTQLAGVALQLAEYDAAATRIDEAMAIHRAVTTDADPATFTTRVEAGQILMRKAKPAEAQAILEGVVRDATAAGDAAALIAVKAELIDVLDERGDYAAAEVMAKEVLEENARMLGAGHPNTVAVLTSLGSIYRKQGRLAEAEVTFLDAFERYGKVLGEDHRATIIAANNLGEILEKEGLFDRAEPYLRDAVQRARKSFGETHPTTLVGMNNLGLLYESQGNFDKAEAQYKSAIAVFSKRLGPQHPDTVAFVNNLAYLYMLKEEFDKAAPMFRQVVDSWTTTFGPRHQNTLKAQNSLARAYHRMGRLPEAEKLFTTTLALRRAVLGDKHMDVLRSMHDLAALHRSAKRLDAAQTLLEQTLAADDAILGTAHPYTFETLNTLAKVKEDKGDLAGAYAVRHTTFIRRNDFLNRMLYVTGDNAREGYVRLHAPELAAYEGLLTRLDPDAGGRGLLEVSLNRKGLLLKVASELQQAVRLSNRPELKMQTEELTAVRKRVAALTLSGPTEETRDRHAEIVHELEERINQLQGDLGRASVRFQKTVEQIKVEQLVEALPDDAVLVDFLLFTLDNRQRLVAATLRKDNGKPVFGLVEYADPAAVDAVVTKYRTDIQNEEIELDEMLDSGQAVYNTVWKPLEANIINKARVFVVPDGMLNILPFAAMVEKSGKYLIERVDLHIYTTSRNLLPNPVPPAKGGYMINAGPDYNTDEVTGKETLEKVRSRSRAGGLQEGLRGMSSGMRGLKFDPLPGAEKEGQLIRQKVEGQGKPNVIFSKSTAQEKVLREMSEPPEILHIATHGFFLKADDTLRKRLLKLQRSGDIQLPPPGDNPLLRSGLAFAGINANAQLLGEIDTDNDGVLTALEVLGLDLTGTRLAILSACETGLGEIHEGEGVYGLRRSFQEAGVGSVVSSLWEVSDAGTQTLMTALYSRLLTGMAPHKALREAQLEMLRIGQWSSPYIWSAFFMVDG